MHKYHYIFSSGMDSEFDVLIVGHTHKAGQRGKWYYNSGCWASKKNSFVRISGNGKVEVFDWVNGKEDPNTTEL